VTWLGSVQENGHPDRKSAGLRFLCEFDGRDGPFAIVASDRGSQPVHFIQPKALHRTGFSVGEDHGFADKLGLGMFKLNKDRGRMDLRSWHWVTRVNKLSGSVSAFERCSSRGRHAAKRCRWNRDPGADLET